MPPWLQTVLIITAGLIALYLIAVLVQIILVKMLRWQAEPMRVSITQAQQDVMAVRERLEHLAPAITSGTREMPFGPLYDQARDLLKKGLGVADELQKRVMAIAAQQIPEQPTVAAFKLIPMSKEVAALMGARNSVRTMSVQLTEVNDTLARIQDIQTDLEALPGRERDALLQLQKRSAEAAALVEVETRPKRPMAEARDALRRANALMGEAAKLLVDDKPPQSAVIVAYPLRLKAEEQLDTLDESILEARDKRVNVEAAMTGLVERLTALRNAISEDEAAGWHRPNFQSRANELDRRTTAAQALVEQGTYDQVTNAITELSEDIVAQQNALAALKEGRAGVTAMADNASQRLATVTQWINEAPQTFDLDVTCAASQQLQDTTDRLRALVPVEDVQFMSTAGDLDRQIEEVFKRAGNVHAEFVAGERRFDDLAMTLNDFGVQVMASQARQVAAELGKANPAYWGDLTPEAVTASADELVAGWQSISGQLGKIKESELADVLAQMEEVQTAYDRVSELHGAVVKSLTQLDADKLQAETALNDDMMARLMDDAAAIGQASPSFAEQPGLMRARVEALRDELKQDVPNYHAINARAQRLRREAEEFVSDYRQQLQDVSAKINDVAAALKESIVELNRLDDGRVSFATITEPVAERATAWVAHHEGIAIPLDAARAALAEGESLQRDVAAALGQAAELRKLIEEQSETARTALAEVNGVLSAAQAGIGAMADAGSERWGGVMLDAAHGPMTKALELLGKLEFPAQPLTPEVATSLVERIGALVTQARQRADDAHAEITRRVAEIKQQRVALSHAYELADTVANEYPERQTEWSEVRQALTQLEQRWTNASSFTEALDAMTQAVQRAERFAQEVHS